MISYITNAFNDTKVLCVEIIFLDCSNAYNNIEHDKLFQKFLEKGISGTFLDIIVDSFKDRKEFIMFNNASSHLYNIDIGIPQGGVSSPIYFNLYKSDLNKVIKHTKLFEFSDDTAIVNIVRNNNGRINIQTDLESIAHRFRTNNLLLNNDETHMLTIQHKKYAHLIQNK